jgi:hypothetical protein
MHFPFAFQLRRSGVGGNRVIADYGIDNNLADRAAQDGGATRKKMMREKERKCPHFFRMSS